MEGFDEVTEIYLLNAMPGIAANGFRDALNALHSQEISDQAAVERVTPVIRYAYKNIVNYCDSITSNWGYISEIFPDCKVVNKKYNL